MNQNIRGLLKENNFDVDNTVERFMGNEDLYIKFLKKFLQDDNFNRLSVALKERNCKDAFERAHTLKGVTANLGIEGMYRRLIPLVEKLRADNLDGTEKDLEELDIDYKSACEIIEKL